MNDLHEDAAAYALDALDTPELEKFEEHLASCADCRREVAELQDVVSGLSLAEPAPLPPPSLRASVLDAISGVPQLPAVEPADERVADSASDAGSTAGSAVGSDASVVPIYAARRAAGPVPAIDPVVDELALRRASRRARVLSVLVAAVTVVALALGGTVWGLVRQQDRPPVAGPAPTVTVPQVDPSLLAAPDARIVAAKVNGADASFIVSKSLNRAAFVSSDLPSPGAGNVFHLWRLRGTAVEPDNVFSSTGQVAQSFSGPVDDFTTLAINIEPEGTSPQAPTSDPLAIAAI